MKNKIHIIGGGTYFDVRPHLSLAARARGTTAKSLKHSIDYWPNSLFDSKDLEAVLHLTSMGDPDSSLVTNEDVAKLIDGLIADPMTRVIIMNAAMCDFEGHINAFSPNDAWEGTISPSGKDQPRLRSTDLPRGGSYHMSLHPAEKVLRRIRKDRKDIFLVAFKVTAGATPQGQFDAGLKLLKDNSCNLVLANDYHTKLNMVVTPEEAPYCVTNNRAKALNGLLSLIGRRVGLNYTRSTVVDGDLVPWESEEIPAALRQVVDHCIGRGAYKPFNGKTAGHFAVRVSDTEFITSCRKTDFNTDLRENGMCRVTAKGDHEVVAVGAKPSVGGQSQRIIFGKYPNLDSIVHFHCPLKREHNRLISTRPQGPYECGSHECGQNTADGLRAVAGTDDLMLVYLENHGPNIVFNSKTVPAPEVIGLIEEFFDLEGSTRNVRNTL